MSDSKSEDTSVEKQIYEILKTTDAWLSNPLEEVRDSAYMQELLQLIERSKLEARESTRKLYDKELKMHRDFMTNVLARENLKTDKTMSICDVCLTQLQFQRDKLRMEGNK